MGSIFFTTKVLKKKLFERQNYLKQHCGKYESNLHKLIHGIPMLLNLDIFPISEESLSYTYIHIKRRRPWSCRVVDHKGTLMHKNTKNFEEEMKEVLDVNHLCLVSPGRRF